MANRMTRLSLAVAALLASAVAYADGNVQVHAYKPFEVGKTGIAGQPLPAYVKSEALSTRFAVKVEGVEVSAVRYDNSDVVENGHTMDVARFATNSLAPVIEISLLDGDDIESVAVHPMRYYPASALAVDKDRRTLRFKMSESLPYAIVTINGADPDDATDTNPQLTIINDPIEPAHRPALDGDNVLDFKKFAQSYLKSHPVKDRVGAVCRKAGSVTDNSLNDEREFTWNYDQGKFLAYDSKRVAFPDKRARNRNDVSDALKAALDEIKSNPELNTLYIPAGIYLWSGLRVENWNGDEATGGKPLHIYTDEGALMVNRLKECREANEPAIFIYNSSHVTISGRGMHDAQGCRTYAFDRKDARNTPHQGGAVVRASSNIAFYDTYVRDAQQWNWEVHNVVDVTLNNVKGLTPYKHAWIDGLNMSSGKNVTVNGAITLGNDDTFATGHYNPSDEFPARTYRENQGIDLVNTDANEAEFRHTFAAAGIYNRDRMEWSPNDTENISVNNTIGWTRTAHCIRIGINNRQRANAADFAGRRLKGFYFNNFNSVVGRKADGDIRIIGFNAQPLRPVFESIEIVNSSFWKPGDNWARIQTLVEGEELIDTLVMKNLIFVKPIAAPKAIFTGATTVILDNIEINH